MSRKPKKGYFVRGHFVAEGSELDLELKRELKGGDAPSKTELKAQSAELQALGEALLELRRDLFEPLDLPPKLIDALAGETAAMAALNTLMALLAGLVFGNLLVSARRSL